ncbi:hypothetical protein [Gloeothece verrucosa]|uniref:PilZ domain-containing protein n=1 Tax=Gloeothece verrucosa (strain PCC 7822) TaxID=497965 RepID=E0U8Q8_GLOV7|nr:hypothetical protein [Gloeothece verrucosa]ADN14922.1 conserved hypothetical protein [Gloeothece verrucosa PCC 7822]
MNSTSERRIVKRTVAFCQVLDLDHNFLGITFDLTLEGICLSLPNSFSSEINFFVILKPTHADNIPEVIIKVQPIWRKKNHSEYDEIGGKIIQIWPEDIFKALLIYYEKGGPCGLIA